MRDHMARPMARLLLVLALAISLLAALGSTASADPVPGTAPASCMAFISALAPFDLGGTTLTRSAITDLMRAETSVERAAGAVGSHASRHARTKYVSDLAADCIS